MIFFSFWYNEYGWYYEWWKTRISKETIEEIKRKVISSDEGTEALADYTYDELYKKEYDDYMEYGD